MAQAGIHSLVGMAVRKWAPARAWLMLGIVLGSLIPDLDNIAVAVATLSGASTAGLHRTFTHSIFFVLAIFLFFYGVAAVTKSKKWSNLGVGLGIGVFLHVLLDLLIWFNGVELFWPIPSWINLWGGVIPPEWFSKLMLAVEFLFIGLFFLALVNRARVVHMNSGYLKPLKFWMYIQFGLFLVFTVLVYSMESGFMTSYGAVYLLSLGLAIVVTIRMRDTLEAASTST